MSDIVTQSRHCRCLIEECIKLPTIFHFKNNFTCNIDPLTVRKNFQLFHSRQIVLIVVNISHISNSFVTTFYMFTNVALYVENINNIMKENSVVPRYCSRIFQFLT